MLWLIPILTSRFEHRPIHRRWRWKRWQTWLWEEIDYPLNTRYL